MSFVPSLIYPAGRLASGTPAGQAAKGFLGEMLFPGGVESESEVPTITSPEVEEQRRKQLIRARLQKGRRSTILTGPGIGEADVGRPTLLGGA